MTPSDPGRPIRPASVSSRLIRASVSAVTLGLAWGFTLWFLLGNTGLWRVFPALLKNWDPWWTAESLTETGLWVAGSAAALALACWTGFLFLRRFDLHAERHARPALALLFGLCLHGVLLEWLAMPGLLFRSVILVFGAAMLAALLLTGPGRGARAARAAEIRHRDRHFRSTLILPRTFAERSFAGLCGTLIALITLAVFYHALLYPEAYWDSLILYLGYARMMFLEQGVVRKVTGQVGIGLGANYPHMFEFLGAGFCAVAGSWSELPQRLLSPAAGTAAALLVFSVVLRMSRHLNFALAVTLLYRSVPLGISFDQYATNYSMTVFVAAAFLYLALLYIETGVRSHFVLLTLLVGFGMHINYLMGILWAPWGMTLLAAHFAVPRDADEEDEEADGHAEDRFDLARALILTGDTPTGGTSCGGSPPPERPRYPDRPGLLRFVFSRPFLFTFAITVALGSTWHLRNWIVTGNPVYAFFPEVFGGRNINPEVMRSAAEEWLTNGAGIGRHGEDFASRVRATWDFTVHGWRLGAIPQGFVFAAIPLLLARMLVSAGRRASRSGRGGVDSGSRFMLVVLTLTICLFAYKYLLAPYYLYQILMILPCFAVLLVAFRQWWAGPVARRAAGALVLLTGLVPGLAMALMGFKVANPVFDPVTGRMESPLALYAFRHPLPPAEVMYRWRYDRDASMAGFVSRNLAGRRILTHENRHLMFDPSVTLVHLDDWEMQRLWDRPAAEQTAALLAAGIEYYLYVPNEEAHRVNRRMGAAEWIRDGWVSRVYDAGPNVLYKINAERKTK